MNRFIAAIVNHPIRTAVVVILIIGGFAAWRFWPRYYNLSIEVETSVPGYEVQVFSGASNDSGEPIVKTTESQTFSLRSGEYVVVGGTAPDFSPTSQTIALNEDISISTRPVYSDLKLSNMLDSELPAIQQAIRSSVSGFSDEYKLGRGRLYDLGQWYGTIIYPNLSAEQLRVQYVDVFRLVMKKEGGKWTLATNPPRLVLGQPNYPNIPFEVLNNTNNQLLPGANSD